MILGLQTYKYKGVTSVYMPPGLATCIRLQPQYHCSPESIVRWLWIWDTRFAVWPDRGEFPESPDIRLELYGHPHTRQTRPLDARTSRGLCFFISAAHSELVVPVEVWDFEIDARLNIKDDLEWVAHRALECQNDSL